MALVVECPSCTRKLRVPDELVGTRVKCPTCSGVFNADGSPPAPSAPEPARSQEPPPLPKAPRSSSSAPPLPESQSIPPVPKVQLKLTLDEEGPRSRTAPEKPPTRDQTPRPSPRRFDDEQLEPCPYCGERIDVRSARCPHCKEELDSEEDDRPWERRSRGEGVRRDWEPHRGSLILVMGIISVVSVAFFWCFLWAAGLPLGIVAWVMGHRDLKKMEAHLMDPEGRGTTQGGWICGIIGTILNGLAALGCLGWFAMIGLGTYSSNRATPVTPPPGRGPGPQPPARKFVIPDAPLRLQDYLPPIRK